VDVSGCQLAGGASPGNTDRHVRGRRRGVREKIDHCGCALAVSDHRYLRLIGFMLDIAHKRRQIVFGDLSHGPSPEFLVRGEYGLVFATEVVTARTA
jgi:hypothetical protein